MKMLALVHHIASQLNNLKYRFQQNALANDNTCFSKHNARKSSKKHYPLHQGTNSVCDLPSSYSQNSSELSNTAAFPSILAIPIFSPYEIPKFCNHNSQTNNMLHSVKRQRVMQKDAAQFKRTAMTRCYGMTTRSSAKINQTPHLGTQYDVCWLLPWNEHHKNGVNKQFHEPHC